MFIIAKCKKLSILGPPKERKLLSFRGLSGIAGLVFGFFAIKLINPSDLKVINHSNIIFTAILARIFLKEKLTIMHIVTFCLTVVGVVFIAQPGFLFNKYLSVNVLNQTTLNETNEEIAIRDSSLIQDKSLAATFGVTFAIISAFGAGSSRVILKKLCNNKVHFSIATIYASYFGLPLSIMLSVVLTLTGVTHKEFFEKELKHLPKHLLYTTIAAFIGIFAQVLLNLALKYEDATKLGIVKTVDVFFAFILQYFLLNIKVNMFSIIGVLSILLGAVLLLLFKIIEAKLSQMRVKRNIVKNESIFSCREIIFYKF
jgi:drug/metabolite transporter (DMT)-like permease